MEEYPLINKPWFINPVLTLHSINWLLQCDLLPVALPETNVGPFPPETAFFSVPNAAMRDLKEPSFKLQSYEEHKAAQVDINHGSIDRYIVVNGV